MEEARQEEENQREEIDEDLEPHVTTADVQAQIRERAAEHYSRCWWSPFCHHTPDFSKSTKLNISQHD